MTKAEFNGKIRRIYNRHIKLTAHNNYLWEISNLSPATAGSTPDYNYKEQDVIKGDLCKLLYIGCADSLTLTSLRQILEMQRKLRFMQEHTFYIHITNN